MILYINLNVVLSITICCK